MNPEISVLTPVYNGAEYIVSTIDSVLSQTFKDFEFLLLDDESTDNSKEIILSYNDPRIRLIECPHNFINTLNIGLSLAKGKYIALLDHDDLMMPYRLRTQYDFMENNLNIDACGGYMHTFGKYSILMKVPLSYEELFLKMILTNQVHNSTTFIRKDFLLKNAISYQHGYSFVMDYKFWFEVGKAGIIQNIPKILTLYRTSDTQASIKYKNERLPSFHRIQREIISYFFNQLGNNNPYEKLFYYAQTLIKTKVITDNNTFVEFIYQTLLGIKRSIEYDESNN